MHFFAFGVIIIIIIIISVVTFFMLSVSILLLSLLISSLNIKLFIIIEIFWFGHNQRVFRRSPELCLTFRLSDQVHGSSKNWLLRKSTPTPFFSFLTHWNAWNIVIFVSEDCSLFVTGKKRNTCQRALLCQQPSGQSQHHHDCHDYHSCHQHNRQCCHSYQNISSKIVFSQDKSNPLQ